MSSPGPSNSNRQELIQNAILFLNDPKVASSSLTSRITFLEGKGLTEGEIHEALSRAAGSSSSVSPRSEDLRYATREGGGGYGGYGGGGYGQMVAPSPPKRDWRDLFASHPVLICETSAPLGTQN